MLAYCARDEQTLQPTLAVQSGNLESIADQTEPTVINQSRAQYLFVGFSLYCDHFLAKSGLLMQTGLMRF